MYDDNSVPRLFESLVAAEFRALLFVCNNQENIILSLFSFKSIECIIKRQWACKAINDMNGF